MGQFDDVLREATKNNRVCPMPFEWRTLYDMLPEKRQTSTGWEPPPPLILAAWWHTLPLAKTERFRLHLDWAESHGCINRVEAFLRDLPEDKWYHLTD